MERAELETLDEAPALEAAPRRRRRRWPLVVALIAAAVYAAPWLLSIKGVSESVTATALPWLPPGSDIGQPSLGWMSPVHLAGLRILDDQGRVLLECDHITSQKSLWEMAASPRSPGGWVLEKPRAFLHVDPTGINLNPVVRKFLARKKNARPLNFDVTIDNGTIEFLDPSSSVLATISGVEAKYANAALLRSIEARGELSEGDQTGTIDIHGRWATTIDPAAMPIAELQGRLTYLPLSLFGPWLQANSTIESVAGGGEVVIALGSNPTIDGSGSMTAQASFVPRDAIYRRRGDAQPQPVQRTDLVLGGYWDAQADRFTFETANGSSGLLSLEGHGVIDQPRAAGIVDLKTTADQDLSGLLDLLNPQLRSHVVINGLRVQNVAVTGALWPDRFVRRSADEASPPAATLAGDITWTEATLYGVRATPGAVTAAFQPQGIALWPRDVRVGDGQLLSLPEIRLVDQRQLVAPPGPMLVDVNMTPEMCRQWLKYVSPVLADATEVDGRLTLIVESGQMPLAQPESAEISGIVRVHSARVTPGPLARQAIESAATLARLITQRAPAWADRELQIELPPQDIAFRMHQGRVYHQGITFQASEVVVTTRGSVGLDQTLDMLVEVPIPDIWLQRGPLLKSLQGEVVTIPLRGTLERPQVDGRALAEFGKRLGAGAAGGLLQNLLDRGLDRAAEKAQRRRDQRDGP